MKNDLRARIRLNLTGFLLFLFITLIAAGALFQTIAEYFDARRFAPEGRLYSLDGYALHLYCTGSGSPTIVLESDLTYPSQQWYLVQRELSSQTQVCSYDRAGMGWSAPSPYPRKGEQIAQELYRLLNKSNVDESFIFVGFRRGTWITRLMAFYYPDMTQGIVLIEPTHESIGNQIPQAALSNLYQSDFTFRLMPVVTWLGITRLIGRSHGFDWYTDPFRGISKDTQDKIFALTIYKTSYWKYAAAEHSLAKTIADELAGKKVLDNIPLVILVNRLADVELNDVNQTVQFNEEYQRLQIELASLSNQSQVIQCNQCGVMPPITAPQEVASVVAQLLSHVKP